MMRQIRVAILGQGRSGRDIHGKNLLKFGDQYKVVAVSDPLEERRKRAEQEYEGCDTYSNYKDLMARNDIDLIVNATPSHLHAPITKEFLENGFNVLCEKPLARTAKEVDELIEASVKSGTVLAVFQQSRYAPAFQQVQQVIDSGVLGRIVQANIHYSNFARRWDWQTLQEFNGGNLLNTGPHPVDQALQLFGTTIMPNINCFMDRTNTFGDAEDYVKLLLSGENKPVVEVEISSCNAYSDYTYLIQGTQGSLRGTITNLEWKYYIPADEPTRSVIREPYVDDNGNPSYCRENLTWHEDSWGISEEAGKDLFGTMTKEFYSMLYKTLTTGAGLEITPQEVRQQIAVIEECHRQNSLTRIG